MASQKHNSPSALLVLVMTLALALFAAACGGGDSEADARADAAQEEAEAARKQARAEAEEAWEAVADTQPDEVVSGREADEVTEEDSDVTPDETEAYLDCRSAQNRVAEAYRDASVARRAHANAYTTHIEAHDSGMNVQVSYDEVIEAAVVAEQADTAATRAQTWAFQACDGTSFDIYGNFRLGSLCQLGTQNLSVAERIYVDRLAALHDARNQSGPEVEIVQAEVDSAWAKIELAEAKLDQSCPN